MYHFSVHLSIELKVTFHRPQRRMFADVPSVSSAKRDVWAHEMNVVGLTNAYRTFLHFAFANRQTHQ
jgi:hypothetical protein